MYLNREKGIAGENLACKYIEEIGYEILQRNYRCRQGEIDIIALDKVKNEMIFIEVKTRSNFRYGKPMEAVDFNKQRHVIEVAKYYIYNEKIKNQAIRFDVIEVLLNNSKYKINHIQNAFFENRRTIV